MRVSLGQYPDQTCFDANRAGWLPYWIDNLTENKCRMNLIISGNTTGNIAQPGDPSADPSTIRNAQVACISTGGKWDPDLNVCAPSFMSQYGLQIGLGVAAVFLILMVTRK